MDKYAIRIIGGEENTTLGIYKDKKTAELMRDNWVHNTKREFFMENYIPYYFSEDGTLRFVVVMPENYS